LQDPNVGQADDSPVSCHPSPGRSEGHGSHSTLRSQRRLLLGMDPSYRLDPPTPGLSRSSSRAGSSSVCESSEEARSTGNGIHIHNDEDLDERVVDSEEPVRTKASYPSVYARPGSWPGRCPQQALMSH
jgi:hypothetical protein